MSDPLVYRGRGRPRLAEGQKKTERLVVSVREEDLKKFVKAAGDAGFRKVQDWVLDVLAKALDSP